MAAQDFDDHAVHEVLRNSGIRQVKVGIWGSFVAM